MAGPNSGAAPPREAFAPQHPVEHPVPVYTAPVDPHSCGNCPGWQRHPRLPFGQCLPAIKAFGAPMYTPELAGCTLPIDVKAKGGR